MNLFIKDNWDFPIEYDKNCYFYKDYLLMDGVKYQYDELSIIYFTEKTKFVNGVKIDDKIVMLLTFSSKNYIPYPFDDHAITGFTHFSYERGLIPTNSKQGRILKFIYKYLQQKTFNDRLRRHINSLNQFGKFTFMEGTLVFCDNGDLFLNDELLGNFKQMNDQGKIIDGAKIGGYKNKTINPYTYGFEKGTKFFGWVSDKVSFENTSNRDVMQVLFKNLYETGKMRGKKTI